VDFESACADFDLAVKDSLTIRKHFAGTSAESRGPNGAFVKGQESAARQQLFGKIAPVYDQVPWGSMHPSVLAHDQLQQCLLLNIPMAVAPKGFDKCVFWQLNNTLSLGQHRVWKRMAVKWSMARSGHAALDVCCGSGALAFILADAVGSSGQVFLQDPVVFLNLAIMNGSINGVSALLPPTRR